MHISIEGFDGVGKTTVSKLLAEKINFTFVEKPLKYLFDPNGGNKEYIRIRDYMNDVSPSNNNLSACFYGLGHLYMYEKFKGSNIITDRHILSNYAWSGSEQSKKLFDTFFDIIGSPDFTFILYANEETVIDRLNKRDKQDSDLHKTSKLEEIYSKMHSFANEHSMPFEVIDSNDKSPNQIIAEMITILNSKGIL